MFHPSHDADLAMARDSAYADAIALLAADNHDVSVVHTGGGCFTLYVALSPDFVLAALHDDGWTVALEDANGEMDEATQAYPLTTETLCAYAHRCPEPTALLCP